MNNSLAVAVETTDYKGRVFTRDFHARRDAPYGPGWFVFARGDDYGGQIIKRVAWPAEAKRRARGFNGPVQHGFASKAEAQRVVEELKIRFPKPNPGKRAKARANPAHKPRSADKTAVRELLIFIEQDGQLYRQRGEPINKNLEAKYKKGNYSLKKATKLFRHLADAGAKRYSSEYGGEWNQNFSVPTRNLVARALASGHLKEMRLGNFTT